MYGNQVEATRYTGNRSVLGTIETAPGGNVILRAGHEEADGWVKTEHIVLTPAEALELARELQNLAEPSLR